MSAFPDTGKWRAACAGDAVLAAWAGPWSVCFGVQSDSTVTTFAVVDGLLQPGDGRPAFTVRAPSHIWAKFLQRVPPRHHHGLFAMMYRVPEFGIDGDMLTYMQHVHVVRRILEIGKWLALGQASPVPSV